MSRISLGRLGCVLAAGALLAAAESPTEEAPKRSRRPVMAPGQETPAAPPPPVEVIVPPQGPDANQEPSEPPPPLDFVGAPEVVQVAEEEAPPQEGFVGEPGEVRYSLRRGEYLYAVTIRPGLPKAGEPVELSWTILKQLLIPDPYLGDRAPLEGVEVVAKVGGPEPEKVYLLHPGARPGSFGHRFTPGRDGAYKVALARKDGRKDVQVEVVIPVGGPPLQGQRDLKVDLVPMQGPDLSSLSSSMKELGRRWMALERKAGTAAATEAHGELASFAQEIRDEAPPKLKGEMDGMVAAIQRISTQGTRETILATMDEINFSQCLRCHAASRLQFAKDVSRWPSFTPNDELKPPAAKDPGAPARRGPLTPQR